MYQAKVTCRSFICCEKLGAEVDLESNIGGLLNNNSSQVSTDVEGINIADRDILQAALTVKFCDECGQSIPNGAKYYHCGICLNDDWDSCEDCVEAGFSCRDEEHKMVMRQMKNGMIIDIE